MMWGKKSRKVFRWISLWAISGVIFPLSVGCGSGAGNGNGHPVVADPVSEEILPPDSGTNVIGEVLPLDSNKVVVDPDTQKEVVNDQILITFKDSVSEETAKLKIASINGEVVGYIQGFNDYQVRIKGNPTLDQLKALIDQLNNDPDVEAAALNTIHQLLRVPDSENDPQWFSGIDWDWTVWSESDPRGRNWGLEAIYMPSAWDHNDSMSPVKVGIIDGGFKVNHEDLNIPINNATGSGSRYYMLEGEGAADTNGNGIPEYLDKNNHGTHVAGTIGAAADNPMGVTGILWKRDLYLYRTDFQDYDIKYGMVWNLEKGAKVINLSLGAYVKAALGREPVDGGTVEIDTDDERNFIEKPRAYWTAFMEKLISKYDFLIVQAAGNEGIDAKWSGLFNAIDDETLRKRIITVGAVNYEPVLTTPWRLTPFYYLAAFSNFGPKVEIVAPGVDVYSTIYSEPFYGSSSGTSMAAPHVTGVAGLVWGANPGLSAEQVKEIVVGTADRPITYEGRPYKLLNARAAVERAENGQAGQPISQHPTGVLIGKVQDAVNSAAINDAQVSVLKDGAYHAATRSMSDGSYELVLETGSYTVTIGKEGYFPENIVVIVSEGVTTYISTLRSVPSENSGNGTLSGYITNGFDGQGIGGLTIHFRRGIDVTTGEIAGTSLTGTNGFYSILLPSGNYTGEIIGTGYSTGYFLVVSVGGTMVGNQNGTVTPILPEGRTRIILTWGAVPSDLDSHLTGPFLGSTSRFHVYYSNKGSQAFSPYTELDVDDISSYGPETITIYQQTDGVYRYSVHDYTNRNAAQGASLSNSGAQVRVYRGNSLAAQFNVPVNREGTLWTVFELSGGVITPVNAMSFEPGPASVQRRLPGGHESVVSDGELIKNSLAK